MYTLTRRLCIIFVSVESLCCFVGANAQGITSPEAGLHAALLQDLEFLHHDVLIFWRRYGLDNEHGGFHGTLDEHGNAVNPTTKGLVQQARHVWAFSTFHLHGHAQSSNTAPGGRQLPSASSMAQSAYAFMLHYMRDSSDGLWHWNVTRQGEVVQSLKVLYGHWFVLYAFAQYHAAFGDASAKDLALKTFATFDALWHTQEYGGYTEAAQNGFPAESVGVGIGLREQDPDEGLVRTFNTLLHGIEALTALHKVTGDTVVLHRLLDLLDIVCSRLQREEGLVYEEYHPAGAAAQWTPAAGTTINYGHNLEACWLVLDTVAYLQQLDAIDTGTAHTYRQAAVSIGTSAVHVGYDQQHGGVFESGTAEGPVNKVKFWWIQAEAMLALWKLHEHFKGCSEGDGAAGVSERDDDSSHSVRSLEFLQRLVETTQFVKQHLVDAVGGEQYWQVEADGTWQLTGITDKDTKGNRWKAAYHSSRAPLLLTEWMQKISSPSFAVH